MKLKFGKGNSKLDKKIATFSLLSGWTCPFACECLSKVDNKNGKLKLRDGPQTKIRCFSASQEAFYKNVYEARRYNTELLKNKTVAEMANLIQSSLPKADIVRIHVAGDFFNQDYFDAWCVVAKANPSTLFYAYTKSLKYWLNGRKRKIIPKNLILTASYGGRHDNLIKKHRLKYAKIVMSEDEAKKLNLEIDHDDSHAMKPGNFALLVHGIQPKGSKAGKAVYKLKGLGSYSKKKKKK